ncbi:hypothetical protein [Stenotrophomonas chelatiphaga]|nr:hypothetical protein [Stenotrophomonas chelatiphaga]
MNESQAPATPPPHAMVDGSERLSRVRDRTDELELFISGLLAFTLLAVPGRIFDAWATNTVHTEGIHAHALWFGFSIAVGLCYVVAIALIAHLAIRGYWVGLIGLKTHFPQGIRWDRIPLLGGVSRDHYQRMVSTLEQSIAGADRLASVLFSTTLLFALTMVWTGLLTAVLLAIAGVVGALLGAPDQVALTVLGVAYVLFTVTSVLPLVLERAVLRRRARGLPSERLERAVRVVLRGMGFVLPLRLLLPVQLTLQSNLYARNFYVVYFGAVMLAMVIGGVQTFNSTRFALFNRYAVVTDEAVDHGMASAHYESLRSEHDRLLRYPMIPADQISESQLRLFIPHQPQRDNSVARRLCTDTLPKGANVAEGEQAARTAVACLARLWTITLDGAPVALDAFVPMERRDLEMRGLVGYLPLQGLPPGRHDLRLVWNAQSTAKGRERRREFQIPFWYAPD